MTTKTVNGQPVNIYTVDEIHAFIYQVLAFGKGVTEWEQGFMKDMEGKSWYSEKMQKVIERIYTQRTQ